MAKFKNIMTGLALGAGLLTLSTFAAAATGGLSVPLTTASATAAGSSVALTPATLIANVGQGLGHNFSGIGSLLSGLSGSGVAAAVPVPI